MKKIICYILLIFGLWMLVVPSFVNAAEIANCSGPVQGGGLCSTRSCGDNKTCINVGGTCTCTQTGSVIILQTPFWEGAKIESGDRSKGGFIIEYINAFYKFFSGLAALVAVVMIMIGGLQMTIGGGVTEQYNAGKERIKMAVTGLVLLMVSAILLYTINPAVFNPFAREQKTTGATHQQGGSATEGTPGATEGTSGAQ